MTALRWGGATDVGVVRSENQDSFLLGPAVFVVADGMGGHRGGATASRLAVDAVAESFHDPTIDSLLAAVDHANAVVFSRSQDDPNLAGMGTTLVAIALIEEEGEERLAIVNVGDSRAYLLKGGEFQQLTRDHSLVAELVRDGRLTPADAEHHPQRNIVTRVVGIDGDVVADEFQILPFAGDRYLLCSDGLTNEVPDQQIAEVLRTVDDPSQAAERLVQMAKDGGGRDNITVVIVDVVDDGGRARTASAALRGERSTLESEPGPSTQDVPPVPPDVPLGPDPGPEAGAAEPRTAATPVRPAAAPVGPDVVRRPRSSPLTVRSISFVLAILAVLGVAAVVVTRYADGGYFVGVDGDAVAIYKGRPGGFLWVDPEVVQREPLQVDELRPIDRRRLEEGVEQDDLRSARSYVAQLEERATPSTTTTTSSTTTSAAPATTSTTP